MGNVLFALSGGLGPAMRTLPVAKSLAAFGIESVFHIYDAASAAFIEAAGYRHTTDTKDITMPRNEYLLSTTPHFWNLDHYHANFGFLDPEFVRSLVEARKHLLQVEQIDAVVSDLSLHTIIAARALGLPVVTVNQSCFHPNGRSVIWWSDMPMNMPDAASAVNIILKELSLPPIHRMEDLNRGVYDLFTSFPEFDPVETDGHTVYLGPIEYEAKDDRRQQQQSDEPFILVYPGRLTDGAGVTGLKIVHAVIVALEQSEIPVYMAVQEPLPPNLTIPGHVHVISHYSASFLRRAALFIHHGGHGCCMSAARHGIPSLVIPTISERQYNARQAMAIGIGEWILPECISPGKLRDIVHRLLNDDKPRTRAALWRDRLADRYPDPAGEAARFIAKAMGIG